MDINEAASGRKMEVVFRVVAPGVQASDGAANEAEASNPDALLV